jgi:hypothetical protein
MLKDGQFIYGENFGHFGTKKFEHFLINEGPIYKGKCKQTQTH